MEGDRLVAKLTPQQFAEWKHRAQLRRDGTPYVQHPGRVAAHVQRTKGSSKNADADAMETAAWLHDTLEDTDTSYEELESEYGSAVANLVRELTSDKEESKRVGKTQYLQHKLSTMSNYALIVKLADRLDNLSDLETSGNPEWSERYAQQTRDILEYLVDNRELTKVQLRLIAEINELL